MFDPATPRPRIMPDCLESNQCYVRRWRDSRSIWGDTAVPATIQFTPLLPPLKSPFLSMHTDTHVKITPKGGRKRKVDRMADFHGVALVSSSQGRQACRRPVSAKSALRRALPLQTAWTTLLRRANTCAAMHVCEEGHCSNCPDNCTAAFYKL